METAHIKVPAELFALAESSRFEGSLDLDGLQAGPDSYVFDEPVAWSVDVTNTGEALLVMGTATTAATTRCSRCLDEVSFDLKGSIEGYFLIDPEGREGEEGEDDDADDSDEEFEELPADHVIDLEPLIRAALLMDVPDKPLCRDDCKGLCPRCGANLNEGPCGCGDALAREEQAFEDAKNPFSALKGYRFDD